MASLRYNPWAKEVYDRICGKQKTRKKKAAIALARKIAVLAWAMLRDEKDWAPELHSKPPMGQLQQQQLPVKQNPRPLKRKPHRQSQSALAHELNRPWKSLLM